MAQTARASVAVSAAASATAASRSRGQDERVDHSSSSGGVTVRTPEASPSHQIVQDEAAEAAGRVPLSHRLPIPMLALIAVLPSAARPVRASTSRSRSIAGRNPARPRSQAPATASRVLPAPMAALTGSGTGVSALNTNAPRNTPRTARRPSSRRAARATPLGGHTGAMLVCTNASANAALALATYRAATSAALASDAANARTRPASTPRGSTFTVVQAATLGGRP
jgi:hypothetical protein